MPIYEYRCEDCQNTTSVLVIPPAETGQLECTNCQSLKMTRLFSSFSVGKGETYLRKGIYEDILSDNQLVKGLNANDPRALADWNQRMSQGAGEDIGPEYKDMQDKLKSGQSVDSVIRETKSAVNDSSEAGD